MSETGTGDVLAADIWMRFRTAPFVAVHGHMSLAADCGGDYYGGCCDELGLHPLGGVSWGEDRRIAARVFVCA